MSGARTAFDIDGVMLDFVGQVFLPTVKRLHPQIEVPEDYQQPSWSFRNLLTQKQEQVVWESPLLVDYMWLAKPNQKAIDFVKDSWNPIFITSRSMLGSDESRKAVRMATHGWLSKVGVGRFATYFAHSADKAKLATYLKVTEAWEDHPETVQQYAEAGIVCHMPVYLYNQHIEGENIIRHEDWMKE
jgi:hypothetical protein